MKRLWKLKDAEVQKVSMCSLDSIEDSSGQRVLGGFKVFRDALKGGEECLSLVVFSQQPVSDDS